MLEAQALLDKKWLAIEPTEVRRIGESLKGVAWQELRKYPPLLISVLICQADGDLTAWNMDRLTRLYAQLVPEMMHTLKTSQDVHALFSAATSIVIGLRIRGDLDRSREIGELSQQRLDAVVAQNPSGRSAVDALRPGDLELHRGHTARAMGDFGGAITLYRRAVTLAGPAPYRHFAGLGAATNIAMLSALEGHHDLALQWLETSASLGAASGPFGYSSVLAANIARASLAIESLDHDEAMRIVELLDSPAADGELWPFVTAVRTSAELTFGEPDVAYTHLRTVGFAQGRDLATDSSVGQLTLRAYLDSLIALGEGGMALRLARDAGSPGRAQVPIARTYLLSDRPLEAARAAAAALHHPQLPWSDRREAAGILAVAQLRLEREEEAKTAFHIFANAQTRFQSALNTRIPEQEVRELERLTGLVTARSSCPERQEATLSLAHLTPTEHHVLQRLAEGFSPAWIAEQSNTSTHTVRTHVKRIYRKLGASSRREALMKAELAGLLGWTNS